MDFNKVIIRFSAISNNFSGGETARIGERRHQPLGVVGHLERFAVGIGHRGQVAVGVERERGDLPVGRGDGHRVAVDIPLD